MRKIALLSIIFLGQTLGFANEVTETLKPEKIGVWDKAKDIFWSTFTGRNRVFPVFGKAIFDAAKNGDAVALENLLKNGENIEAEDKDGWTPLLWATNNRHLELVKGLLSAKAKINSKGGSVYNPYPLILAVKNGQPEMVSALLGENPDVEVEYKGKTPLLWAAELGDTGIAEKLLDHQANIEAVYSFEVGKGARGNFTPLGLAVDKGHEAMVGLLLKRQAIVDPVSFGTAGNQSAMAVANGGKRLAIMNMLRKWSITSQKRLSDADVARLGPGAATAYYSDFEEYASAKEKGK